MMFRIFALATSILWAGVAISSPTTATAMVETMQSGEYAMAGRSFHYESASDCNGVFNYRQLIRFVSVQCNEGECYDGEPSTDALVDSLYQPGRHQVQRFDSCTHDNMYTMGLCPC
jgi:hypothetical protein